jgi:DNA-directed RNA polymerase I, II, and III subunit RPABC1
MSIAGLDLDNMNQEELSKLFKVQKTLDKMMSDRGYEQEKKEELTFDNWKEKLKEKKKINGIYYKADKDKKGQIIESNDNEQKKPVKRIYYHYITQKLNVDTIKAFFSIMRVIEACSGIIIIPGKPTQQAKQKLQEISKELPIEIFTVSELVVNITEHELVPKHILLSEKDKKLLLDKYKIKDPNQLPKILLSDPVARYLGLKRGDVVKIIRKSETAGKYITYRIAC